MLKPLISNVTSDRWKDAQEFELSNAQNIANRGDDDNYWWKKQFENYDVLNKKNLPDVIEVGCGPNTNIRLILPKIKFSRLVLEDPLIKSYLTMKTHKRIGKINIFSFPVKIVQLQKKYNPDFLSEPLEELTCLDEDFDLCVCINVLDHVRDADLCLKQIERITKKGGIVIIGQDLSNQDDLQLCPSSWRDVGHPIKIDQGYLDTRLGYLDPLFYKILLRDQGRNPKCHYGTYLMIGQK